jgi:hypothetical protein
LLSYAHAVALQRTIASTSIVAPCKKSKHSPIRLSRKSFEVTLVVSLTCCLLPYSTIFKFRLFFLRLAVSGLCTVQPLFHGAVT